jgi:hypothetical protein
LSKEFITKKANNAQRKGKRTAYIFFEFDLYIFPSHSIPDLADAKKFTMNSIQVVSHAETNKMNHFRRPLIMACSLILCGCCLVLFGRVSNNVDLESSESVFTQLYQKHLKNICTLWGCKTIYIGAGVHTNHHNSVPAKRPHIQSPLSKAGAMTAHSQKLVHSSPHPAAKSIIPPEQDIPSKSVKIAQPTALEHFQEEIAAQKKIIHRQAALIAQQAAELHLALHLSSSNSASIGGKPGVRETPAIALRNQPAARAQPATVTPPQDSAPARRSLIAHDRIRSHHELCHGASRSAPSAAAAARTPRRHVDASQPARRGGVGSGGRARARAAAHGPRRCLGGGAGGGGGGDRAAAARRRRRQPRRCW